MLWHAGGFGGNYQHDPHILYTLSAVQILALFDRLDAVDADKIATCILDPELCLVPILANWN